MSTYRHAEVRLEETECHVDLQTRQVNLIREAPTTQHMVRPETLDTACEVQPETFLSSSPVAMNKTNLVNLKCFKITFIDSTCD